MWPEGFIAVAVAVAITSWWWKRRLAELHRRLDRAEAEQRSQVERSLSSEQEFQARELALLNSMVEGVLLLDANGRVRLSNQALDRLFGIRHDIRGQTLLEAFRLEDLQQVMQRVLRDGQVLNHELDLPGQERRCIQINATLLRDPKAQKPGLLLIGRDLTRLKQLENTRREFVANVSHELRTPLSMIKGYAETLLNGALEDRGVATRFVATIERHADRLTYLIEDLLTMSSLESGQVAMNIVEMPLQPVVADVLSDLQVRAREERVALANRVDPALKVLGDADRLQQVLFNLVDNAIKYGAHPGRVEVTAETLADPRRVEVRVQDDGGGIPREAIDRVFERFYRVDKGRSREEGGTGLGLAIVKHIVQFHGGEVWVKSDPGAGTAFCFTLPAGRSTSTADAASEHL